MYLDRRLQQQDPTNSSQTSTGRMTFVAVCRRARVPILLYVTLVERDETMTDSLQDSPVMEVAGFVLSKY